MAYRDTWATCMQCGNRFVFKIEEQRRQARQGVEITPPERCPSCQSPQTHARQHPTAQSTAQRPSTGTLGPGPHEGSVKWYDGEKGYGFIIHSSGEEVFFHRTGIADGETPDFADGTKVTYLIETTEKGPQALDVARMDSDDA